MTDYDVIVVGGGHAGCEAALACSRMGAKTLLITMSRKTIGEMSCNPAIGGLSKGQLVKEIDALGGAMGVVCDEAALQFRMLNTKKGPAVRSPRAQVDKEVYRSLMHKTLKEQEGLDIEEAIVEKVLTRSTKRCREVIGILTKDKGFNAKKIILAPGTFLNGLIHIGDVSYPGGRKGDPAAIALSQDLARLGFKIGRLKTGTSPRIDKRSIDLTKLRIQEGDEDPVPFSFRTRKIQRDQLPCYLTKTNPHTHDIIRRNLHRSALYGGRIKGIGVRYCPSLEDKVVRFESKDHHQLFLEPEGRNTEVFYINGLSMSMPEDVQIEVLHSIAGLEEARVIRLGYAIEYDFVLPTQLLPTLETKHISGLYLAGQINGTSGYEEAASQGIMAGINAALSLRGCDPFILKRSEAYIGVLIDDLVTKGVSEPYRMFTSRAEYRLVLRQDNADLRLMEYGYRFGLINEKDYKDCLKRKDMIKDEISRLKKTKISKELLSKKLPSIDIKGSITLAKILRRPEIHFTDLRSLGCYIDLDPRVIEQVEIEIKYEGYIIRQLRQIEEFKRLEERRIPLDLDYSQIPGLSKQTRERLAQIRPISIGQASRLPDIRLADISVLSIYLEAIKRN